MFKLFFLKKKSQFIIISILFIFSGNTFSNFIAIEQPFQNNVKASDALSKKLESLTSFSAVFQQDTIASDGRNKRESGYVQIKKPNFFRWVTTKPLKQEIVINDKKIWMVDNNLQQILIRNKKSYMVNTPVQLFTGNNIKEFLKKYIVTLYSYNDQQQYIITPKEEASNLFERLEITFKQGILTSIVLNDYLGSRQKNLFFEVKENSDLSHKIFEINLPKDYDVIDETER